MAVVDLTNRKLIKKDFLVGWHKKEWEVMLQGWQDWKRETHDWKDPTQWFTELFFTTLYHRNQKETFGVEVEVNPYSKAISNITGLVEYKPSSKSCLKLKLNQKLNVAFSLKRQFTDQVTVLAGGSLPISKEAKAASKVGLRIDLNV